MHQYDVLLKQSKIKSCSDARVKKSSLRFDIDVNILAAICTNVVNMHSASEDMLHYGSYINNTRPLLSALKHAINRQFLSS